MLLSPIFYNLLKKSNFNEKDPFFRFVMLNLGILNPIASSVYLSGGASTIIAGEVMLNHGIPVNWLLWLKYLWMPVSLLIILSSYQLNFIYNYFLFNRHSLIIKIEEEEIGNQISIKEKWIISVIFLVLFLWIAGSYLNISNAIPPLIAIILFYFPGINVLNIDDLKKINWNLLIFIGVSISLANLIISSGAGKWLAQYIFFYTQKLSNSRVTFFIILFSMLVLIRLIFPNLTTFNACILPAVLSAADHMHFELLNIAIITILSGVVCFLPFQNISSLLLFENGYYTLNDTILTGFVLTFSIIFVIIFIL
jgi:di/tricarboxylate transporter